MLPTSIYVRSNKSSILEGMYVSIYDKYLNLLQFCFYNHCYEIDIGMSHRLQSAFIAYARETSGHNFTCTAANSIFKEHSMLAMYH